MSVVDTRLLGRPSTFGGAEAEWPDWSFSMRAYGAAIDAAFPGAMEVASRATAPVLVTTLVVPEQNVARQLFCMLAMMTKGPALAIVRQAEISGGGPNGLEAWRLLVRRYEPEASTRTLGLLQQILNPVPFPDNVTGFEEALSKWELTISRWESSSHDALNEGVKIALLLKMAPEPLRQNLNLQGHTKYGVARAAVVNALLSQYSWQKTPEPMEVGEIGGKRPHKGKAKGKGKQKHKPQSKQQDKDYSDYQCHNRGKMGNISSHCWSKTRKGKGKGKDKTVSAVQASPSASSASDVGSIGVSSSPGSMIASLVNNSIILETTTCGYDEDAPWILAIEPSIRNGMLEHLYETAIDAFHEVLVDSGAKRCVCPPFWARDAPHVTQSNACLVTASGEPLDHFGCRRVHLGFARSPARLKVAFTILNVRRPILSVGSLLKHGHGVIFDRENPYLLLRDESTNAVHRVPMEARGNTFVVLGRSVSSMLAPVVKERVAVPVMPAVPVLPSGPHEDRDVLVQALEDQPMELAEEGARGFANPNRPDEETVERHNLTHLPTAAWCDICIRTRGRDAPHREAAASKIDAVRPVIEMDYAEQGMSNQPHDNVKALIAIDRSSGAIYASGVMQKGDDGGYVTQSLCLDRFTGIHYGHSSLRQRTCYLLGQRQGTGQLDRTGDERHHTGKSNTFT